ncbi:MAG: HEAT repeat domain-containing protein [Candidatus Thermoplasmatota archaeon]|nr:HEAT repeat domain-containing protein [Candidatus Thermoplasmatota archaeon]
MESDSNYSDSSSSRIQNLVDDLGDESFEMRKEALMTLKAMLPHSEVSISNNLVKIIAECGAHEAGSRTSFINKGSIELFQNMSELGLEPLINNLLRDGDEYARRVATDALGRNGRMAVLPYLIKCLKDSDMYVRWQAAKGLGRFAGSNDARDALISSMDDAEPYVRKRVARSLEVFGGAGPVDEKIEGPLEKDGKGDIDGDGIPDSKDDKPRKASKKKGKNKQDDLARIADKKKSIDFNTLGTANEDDKDDLKNIKGIGPFLEQKLNALGIYTYKQISNMTPELEDQVNEAIEFFPGRIKRDNWVKQAKDLK